MFAALIVGNTVVWKPASEVALSAKIFMEVLHVMRGSPKGTINLLTGSGRIVGQKLATHSEVKIISFTGSTEVGQQLAEMAAKEILKTNFFRARRKKRCYCIKGCRVG